MPLNRFGNLIKLDSVSPLDTSAFIKNAMLEFICIPAYKGRLQAPVKLRIQLQGMNIVSAKHQQSKQSQANHT